MNGLTLSYKDYMGKYEAYLPLQHQSILNHVTTLDLFANRNDATEMYE